MKNLREAKIAKKEEEKDALTTMVNSSVLMALGMLMLVLFMSLPCVADDSQGYWVFGDSLTSEDKSWASQLNDLDFAHIQNLAQAGSLLTNSSIPKQLSCYRRQVIYWLGTNDAGFGIDEELYKLKLNNHMTTLKNRGCVVYLVLPVQVNITPEHTTRTIAARDWTYDVGVLYTNVVILDAPYDETQTTDGLHPTDAAQFWLAAYFSNVLGLIAP
jgi:hypothetical protein